MRTPFRRYIAASVAGLAIAGVSIVSLSMSNSPAQAQLTVFDPSNYSQNILTAARTLQQINNQITMLQNQAQSLINQARNLTTVNFPELAQLQQTIQSIDQLMGQAQGIKFRVAGLDQQFRTMFPTSFGSALTNNQHVVDARSRLASSISAYQQTMTVQAGATTIGYIPTGP